MSPRPRTAALLARQAALALAQAEASAALPEGWLEGLGLLALRSAAQHPEEHRLDPALGRRLHPDSAAVLSALPPRAVDLAVVLGEGWGPAACLRSGPELLERVCAAAQDRGLTLGPRVGVRLAHAPVQAEVGWRLHARVAVLLHGEAPGPGRGGLRAELLYVPDHLEGRGAPRVLAAIAEERAALRQAADRVALLAAAMIAQGRGGPDLDLRGLEGLF